MDVGPLVREEEGGHPALEHEVFEGREQFAEEEREAEGEVGFCGELGLGEGVAGWVVVVVVVVGFVRGRGGGGGEGEVLEAFGDGVDVGGEGAKVEEGPGDGEEGAEELVDRLFGGREEDEEEEGNGDEDGDGDGDGGAGAHGFWGLVMGFGLYEVFGGMW